MNLNDRSGAADQKSSLLADLDLGDAEPWRRALADFGLHCLLALRVELPSPNAGHISPFPLRLLASAQAFGLDPWNPLRAPKEAP